MLGAVHTFVRNFGTARVMLERAVAIDPNAAWAWSRLGWVENYSDRPERAIAYFERALRLSPLDPMNFNNYVGLACARQVAGDDRAPRLFLAGAAGAPACPLDPPQSGPGAACGGTDRRGEASRDVMMASYPDLTVAKYKEAMVFSPRRAGAHLRHLRAWVCPMHEAETPGGIESGQNTN